MRQKPQSNPSNRTSIIYIVVTAVVVFGIVAALIATVDLGNLFSSDKEPTPDYNTNSIAAQQTVVAENPDSAEQRALLASMLASSGRMPEAIPIYEQAIDLAPNNTEIRLDFARSLQVNGYPQDAEAQFLKVLEIEPRNHSAHYYLARLYLDVEPVRTDQAVAHLHQVIEIAPDSFLADQAQSLLDSMTYSADGASPIATP
ncbi:MAG: tetratricopeptide repeat protein [Thermomicrobiales bacterium]|nr:tetratricopeptide repeat protein [Thermomicrobiales bacterium]